MFTYKTNVTVSTLEGSQELLDFLAKEGFEILIFDTLRNCLYKHNDIEDDGYARWIEYHCIKDSSTMPSSALLEIINNNPSVMRFSLIKE